MLELIGTIIIVCVIVFLAITAFSVFVAYLTQASYVDPLDDDWKDDNNV
jgi:sensor domain CHASE-containing protein